MVVFVKRFSGLFSIMLIIAAVFAIGACSKKNDKDIIDAATKYIEAMAGGDMQYIRRASLNATAEEIDNIKSRLDVQGGNDTVLKAIQGTVTYTVDEDSLKAGGDEASVDVVFEMADWESIAKDPEAYKDADTYAKAIKETDKKISVSMTLELEQNEEKAWKVANYVEVTRKFYDAWTVAKAPVAPGDMVEQINWRYASSTTGTVKYINTDKIECDLDMTAEFGDKPVYYEVAHGGNIIYKSDLAKESLYGIYKSDSGNLEDGDYTFFFYDENAQLIIAATCTVTNESGMEYTVAANSSSRAEIHDKDRVDYIRWWWYDKQDDGVTYVNTMMLCMEVKLKSGFDNLECYFTFERDGKKVFTSKVATEHTCYMITLDEGVPVDANNYLAGGEYKVTMYDKDGNPMASDICKVEGGDISGRDEIVKPSDVVSTFWFGTDDMNKTYTSPEKIELDLLLDSDSAGASVYYEVSYGGKVIYKSMVSGKSFEGVFMSTFEGAVTDGNGHLAAGEYTISFYAVDDSLILTDTCTVK